MTEPMDTGQLDPRALRRDFTAAAATYEQAAVLQREVAGRLDERLAWMRIQPERILDLGSGSGFGTELLKRRYRRADIVQLDLAHAMLNGVRQQARRWFSRQQYVQADARALPLADDSMDLVFSSLMLQWIEQPGPVFDALYRCLRPNGLLIFSSFGPDTLQELRASWAAVDAEPHVHRFIDMHDLGDALVRSGFQDPVMEAERIRVTYPDGYALMRELKHIGAQNALRYRRRALTGRRRLQAMLEAYQAYRIDDRLPATFEVVYGHAWVPAMKSTVRSSEVHIPVSSLRSRRA